MPFLEDDVMVWQDAGLLRTYLSESPTFLVAIVGLGLAVVFQDRVGRAAMVMGMAMALLLVDTLAGPFLQVQLPKMMRVWVTVDLTEVVTILAQARTLARAIAWGLALYAVFGFQEGTSRVGEEK